MQLEDWRILFIQIYLENLYLGALSDCQPCRIMICCCINSNTCLRHIIFVRTQVDVDYFMCMRRVPFVRRKPHQPQILFFKFEPERIFNREKPVIISLLGITRPCVHECLGLGSLHLNLLQPRRTGSHKLWLIVLHVLRIFFQPQHIYNRAKVAQIVVFYVKTTFFSILGRYEHTP